MTAFDEYLTQTFPGVRITSGRRDPSSPLGRANPRSWHNQGKAWDTAPIEGMDFKDYVSRIGKDYDVLEARDEVNNPSRHATGPHWHVAVGNRKEPQPMGLAGLMGQPPQQPPMQRDGLAELLQRLPGAFQQQPEQQPLPQGMQQVVLPQSPQVKLKAFDKGGNGWKIMGIIGDALQTAGGGQGTYAPAMMRQDELETQGRQRLAELMAQREQKQADRTTALQDWQLKQDYQRQNPNPTNAARMLAEMNIDPNSAQGRQLLMQYMQRPIMIGGEAYAPQAGGGLPSGYNPDEWEVVE